MGVPSMMVNNVALALMGAGAGLLFLVAVWWSWAGDGVAIERARWPALARLSAVAGWLAWAGGLVLQVVGFFWVVGVARW